MTYVARCRCGRVELQAEGPHVVHIACYCDDCWPHRGVKTARIVGPPPLEVRMFTRYAPGAVPSDVPSHPGTPWWVGLRLLRAVLAVGRAK